MFSSLGRIYDFENPSYLEANRSGVITKEQKSILSSQPAGWFGIFKFGRGVKYFFIVPFLAVFLAVLLLSADVNPLFAGISLVGVFFLFILLLLTRWMKYRRWIADLKSDIEENNVSQGVGQLKFGRSNFYAWVGKRKLRLPFLSKGTLQPGLNYRFFYLPESGTVLSAVVQDEKSEKKINQGLTSLLAKLNHFRLDCIPDNRDGRLSFPQYSLLVMNSLTSVLLLVVSAGVFYSQRSNFGWGRGGFSLAALSGVIRELNPGTQLLGAVLLILFGVGVFRFVNALLDLLFGKVEVVEGMGSVDIKQSSDSEGDTSSTYYYLIGDRKFRVRKRAFFAFEPGKNYRAYFTPRTKTLVNIEVLN
jgi:hypothetical protein